MGATTTTLISSVNPTVYGQATTITATVLDNLGNPIVTDGGATVSLGPGLGFAFVNGVTGQAVFNLNSAFPFGDLAVGTTALVGDFNGYDDGMGTVYDPSTSPDLNQVVNKADVHFGNTGTNLISNTQGNPFNTHAGQTSATFTARVNPIAPPSNSLCGPPSGQVDFKANGIHMGFGTLNSGQATFTTSFTGFAPGTYLVTADYPGDANFNAAITSDPLTVNIAAWPVTTFIAATPIRTLATYNAANWMVLYWPQTNPSYVGQKVKILAWIEEKLVSNPAAFPSGTITLKEGGVTLATGTLIPSVTLSNGHTVSYCEIDISTLTEGVHMLTAEYSGDATFGASSTIGYITDAGDAFAAPQIVYAEQPFSPPEPAPPQAPCQACEPKIECVDPDDPFELYNVARETFPFVFFCPDDAQGCPPPGTTIHLTCCNQDISAFIPQTADVNEINRILQDMFARCRAADANCYNGNGGGDPPPNNPVDPIPIYGNHAAKGCVKCPNGDEFCWTVPAGRWFGLNQAAVDQAAARQANQLADQHKICLSSLPQACCVNTVFSASITATGRFLASAPSTNFWEISGGALPDGLTFNGGFLTGGDPATITGTPTTDGTFNFTVQITAPNGDHQSHAYTMTAFGTTKETDLPDAVIGTPYDEQIPSTGMDNPLFAIDSGTLPTGFSLSADGHLTGTAVVADQYLGFTFVIRITDELTSAECKRKFFINVVTAIGSLRVDMLGIGGAFQFPAGHWIIACTDQQVMLGVAHGKPGATYDVTLRVRGVIEMSAYTGGSLVAGHVYRNGITASPNDNPYSLVINQPANTYRLNYQSPHDPIAYAVDYYFDVKIKTGATVVLKVSSGDNLEEANIANLTVPDDDPKHPCVNLIPGNQGQFIQCDLISVKLNGVATTTFSLIPP